MRYLYADSEPFPHEGNFLATLKGFVASAARVLDLTAKNEAIEAQLVERRAATERDVEALEAYSSQLVVSSRAAAESSALPAVTGELAASVESYVRRRSEEMQAGRQARMQVEASEAHRRLDENRTAIRLAVQQFLTTQPLIVLDTGLRIDLVGEAYEAAAVCLLPGGIEVSYRLAVDRLPSWQAPRRLLDLAGGEMELQIGLRKKWLSKDMTREIKRIHEQFVSTVGLNAQRAEIHLRKKSDSEEDDLVLIIHQERGVREAEIHRPGEEGTFPAAPDDIHNLYRLWASIREATDQLLEEKGVVERISLDGHDVFEEGLVVPFIERCVEIYAPIVDQIERRSPSPRELSLKLEHPDGRREELYLRKDELQALVGELSERMLKILAPLNVIPTIAIEMTPLADDD